MYMSIGVVTATVIYNNLQKIYRTSAAIWLCQMTMNESIEYLSCMGEQNVGGKITGMLHKFHPRFQDFVKCLKIQ